MSMDAVEGMEISIQKEVDPKLEVPNLANKCRKQLERIGLIRSNIELEFTHLDTPYTDLANRPDFQALGNLPAQTRIQDMLIVNIIHATLENLERRGLYQKAQEIDIRRANLIFVNEVVDILGKSSLPIKESLELLNKVCTTGWTYPDLDEDERAHYLDPTKAQTEPYRQFKAGVGNYKSPNPEDVPSLMTDFSAKLEELLSKAQIRKEEDALSVAAWAHLVLISIHPFADANGRTARALADLVLIRLSQQNPPTIGITDKLSRGVIAGFSSPEEEAQTEAGFILSDSSGSKSPDITDKIRSYISQTPLETNFFAPGSLYNYPGVGKMVEAFNAERTSVVNRARESSNTIVVTSLNHMKEALDVSQRIAV